MKKDVKTVAGWDFERIIPCHGVRTTAVVRIQSFDLTIPPTGRHRKGRKQSVEGSVQVVSRLNALFIMYIMAQLEENNLRNFLCPSEVER